MRVPRSPRVTIEVTEEIIRTSVTADSSHCMIAEAIRAAVPTAQRVSVDVQSIRWSDPKRSLRYTYLTPRLAQVPLIQFDQGVMPVPFRFQLRRGQVTAMHPRKTGKQQTVKAKAWSTLSARKAHRTQQALAKAQLIPTDKKNSGGLVPERIGGRTPPTTKFANIRSFGLRALGKPTVAAV